MVYLNEKKQFDVNEYLQSEEISDLCSFVKQWFNWKKGKYFITFQIESNYRYELTDNKYEFELSGLDIEVLEKNKEFIYQSYVNEMKTIVSDTKELTNIVWGWRNPIIKKQTPESIN